MWLLTFDPFVGIPVFIAKLSKRQYCWSVFEDFHGQEYIQFLDIHMHFSIGGYIVGLNDFVKVSISALLKTLLFIMCIELRNRQQILFLQVSTSMQGGTYFPETRRMLLFSCFFNLNTFLASFHAASRAPCSCHSVSS